MWCMSTAKKVLTTIAAVFGVLLFLIIFLVPHGARQVAIVAQQLAAKLKKN